MTSRASTGRRAGLRVAAAFVVAIVQLIPSAANLVLCSGPDGDLAIEPAFAQDCCTGRATTDSSTHVGPAGPCECIDTPFLQPALQRLSGERAALPPVASSGLFAAYRPIVGLRVVAAPTAEAAKLSSRRSVVLLI